eukprot:11171367-Lingulodinium_polyedra.AAC.2
MMQHGNPTRQLGLFASLPFVFEDTTAKLVRDRAFASLPFAVKRWPSSTLQQLRDRLRGCSDATFLETRPGPNPPPARHLTASTIRAKRMGT